MVHRLVGPLLVAGGAVGTLLIARELLKPSEGEDPLPPGVNEQPDRPRSGTQGSVVVTIEDTEQFAEDFFIFTVRFSNLSNEAQAFDAIMQITDPDGFVAVIKNERVIVDGRSSILMRFSSGNLFKSSLTTGIWIADFFAWESIQSAIILSDTVGKEFVVDVL